MGKKKYSMARIYKKTQKNLDELVDGDDYNTKIGVLDNLVEKALEEKKKQKPSRGLFG